MSFHFYLFQVTSSEEFDQMSHNHRNCSLAHESGDLKYLNNYSKSGCEYECVLEKAVHRCQCIPWNMPRMSMNEPPFCGLFGNVCFFEAMTLPIDQDCNCPNDCRKTTLSIFESSRPLDNTREIAYQTKSFCDYISAKYRGFHLYNYIVNDLPKPDEFDFCEYLVKNEMVVVKIEMATGSVIRSIRDKRFTFESQLSALGMKHKLSIIKC